MARRWPGSKANCQEMARGRDRCPGDGQGARQIAKRLPGGGKMAKRWPEA